MAELNQFVAALFDAIISISKKRRVYLPAEDNKGTIRNTKSAKLSIISLEQA